MSKAPGNVEALPQLYARWMEQLLGASIPREQRATCGSCAMCRPEGQAVSEGERYFDPTTKCCSYTPVLPNFLVGRILADPDPALSEGRASIMRRVEARLAATPLGLAQPPGYASLYDKAETAFGRGRALRCPHYVQATGNCGIWRHREAVCSTWFCKHVRGAIGSAFWRGTILPLLTLAEDALAKWCLLEVGLEADALEALAAEPDWTGRPQLLSAAALDREVDEAAYGRLWGAWRGREAEFYRRCSELVEGLGWGEVLALAGAEGRIRAVLARRAFERLTSQSPPDTLIPGPMQINAMGAETTRIVTYSSDDPLDVPNLVLALLPNFDGRPTPEVVAAIAEHTGITLGIDLVSKLVDFGVLKPGVSSPRGPARADGKTG